MKSYYFTVQMEAVCSPETSPKFYKTTRCQSKNVIVLINHDQIFTRYYLSRKLSK
jgi:hypothetical protein